ncbi:MAG: hypothetical protein ACREYF_03105 [Gammaproteobacteria bacterium]
MKVSCIPGLGWIKPSRVSSCLVLFFILFLGAPAWADSISTSIDLIGSGAMLFNVNHEANSLTVFRVKGGGATLEKLDEVPVGKEPVCVAARGGGKAFVTNSADGTVSVVERDGAGFTVTKEIPVGAEPRACALEGNRLYVANYADGTVSVINTNSETVVDTITLGSNPAVAINPAAIAISDGTVFVTQFFARLIAGGPGEGFDDGKEGVVFAFPVGSHSPITEITLSPLANSGFTADRKNLCTAINPVAPNDTFCPDPTIAGADPTNPIITADPQGVFPNQLKSALICDGKLYLPNIGAQPEPPFGFNVNVQALVHVVDATARPPSELEQEHVNLNAQIATEDEAAGDVPGSQVRQFGNDLVAIDADNKCDNFFIVSRGGNVVIKAQLGPDGKLDIGAPNVVRFQTGNIPTGIEVDAKGNFAYVNNQLSQSVSILDLNVNGGLAQEVPASTPPVPGSFEHARLMGKLVFLTALGVPDNGLIDTPVGNINPVNFRDKQSKDGWSTCASCHDEGLADGVTWIFADGPRQSIPLDGLYSKLAGAHDTRINNWSAARDCVTDFNQNSRAVQGGCGFASDDFDPGQCTAKGNTTIANPAIFDHGICEGASEALDLETTWAQTVRALNAPKPADPASLQPGADVFATNCASCHGGPKWTKSQVIYASNPALDIDANVGGVFRDPGVDNEGDEVKSYQNETVDPGTLKFLEDIGTFFADNAIEIRQNGAPSLGVLGFNVPSLLGVGNSAPYFHNGAAQTLEDVFAQHNLPGSGTIAGTLSPDDQTALLAFLKALDGTTAFFRSETDDFLDPNIDL